MRRLLAALVLASFGCATTPVSIHHPTMGLITVEPEGYGRTCIDLRITPRGEVAITVAQDGTSDWIGVRILPTLVSESVGMVMAVLGAPLEALLQALGAKRTPARPPSPLSACSAIFE